MMKKSCFKQVLIALSLSAMPWLSNAASNTISFQGQLLDADSQPVNGTTNITFSIPSTTWTETHTDVQLQEGMFGVMLGSETSLDGVDFSQMSQLQFSADGVSQVVDISKVPHAFYADTVGQTTLGSLSCGGEVSAAKWTGSQWICIDWASLKGEKGDQGEPGKDGKDGQPGLNGNDGKDGAQGIPGQNGKDGAPGTQGQDGKDGAPGASPFGLSGNNAHYTAGNVGIGITIPDEKLEVSERNTTGYTGIRLQNPSQSTVDLRAYGDSSSQWTGATLLGSWNMDVDLGLVADSKTKLDNGTSNHVVWLKANTGNVGIGTTSPEAKLDVKGDIVSNEYRKRIGSSEIDPNRYINILYNYKKSSANSLCPSGVAIATSFNYLGKTGSEICAGDHRGKTTCKAVKLVYGTWAGNFGTYPQSDLTCGQPVIASWPWAITPDRPNTLDEEWDITTFVVCCE